MSALGGKRTCGSRRLARSSCFSLTKVSPGLFGFDTILTVCAAGNFQRLDDLLMLLKDVCVIQNVGRVGFPRLSLVPVGRGNRFRIPSL
jgi:hypothetical protein